MTIQVAAEDVRRDLLIRREIALLDVREEDPFARAHPLFAALPQRPARMDGRRHSSWPRCGQPLGRRTPDCQSCSILR